MKKNRKTSDKTKEMSGKRYLKSVPRPEATLSAKANHASDEALPVGAGPSEMDIPPNLKTPADWASEEKELEGVSLEHLSQIDSDLHHSKRQKPRASDWLVKRA